MEKCLYCALLIEHHTGRVLLPHNFYSIHGQLDTKGAMSGTYLIPRLIEKLPKSGIFQYYQSDVPNESSFSQEIQL